jgi:enterochelin esterase-like enzyme
MGLTSRAFTILCVVAAVAAPAATMFLWSRLKGPAVLRGVQRLGLIAVCQLLAIALVGTEVNNSFYFYSSWSDLLGTSHVAPVSANGIVPASRRAETKIIAGVRRAHPSAGGGVVLSQTIHGAASGLDAPVLVYLPPQYFQPRYARTRFPVTLVMPGYPGNPKMYVTRLDIPAIMTDEVRAGRAQPFIAVIVKETILPPRDTECANVVHGPAVETFLADDIRSQLAQTLRTRTDRQGWAMMGDSTGGFCAVKMVMRHPRLYGSAVGLSGYYTALLDRTTGSLYGGSRHLLDENSPLWRLQHLPAPPVSVLLTISKQERTYPQTVAFVDAARPPLQVSSIVVPVGGHNTRNWNAVLPRAVDWLSAQFGAGLAAGPTSVARTRLAVGGRP